MADPKYDLVTTVRAADEFSQPIQKMQDALQDAAADAEMNLNRFDRALGKVGQAYGQFSNVAEEAIMKVSRQTATGGKEMARIAKQIVDSVSQTGNIDLGLDRIVEQTKQAQLQLAVLEDMRDRQVALAGGTENLTAVQKLHIATLDQQIAREREGIQVLQATSSAMEAMTGDLAAMSPAVRQLAEAQREAAAEAQRVATAQAEAAAETKRLAQAERDAAVEKERLTQDAVRLRSELDPLFAAQQRYDAELARAEQLFRAGAISADVYDAALERARMELDTHVAAQQRGNAINGQTRAGLQQLSYQLNDVAVQYAAGTPPAIIFAQQSGQVAQAVGLIAAETGKTAGKLAGFARFLGGPWGMAITTGAVVLSPFIAKLFETGNAADDAAAKVANFQQLVARMRTSPMESMGEASNNLKKAEAALAQAKAMPRYMGGGSEEYKKNTFVERKRSKAIADAELLYANAQSELATLQWVENSNRSLFEIRAKAGVSKASKVGGGDDASSGGGRSIGSGGSRSSSVKSIPAVDQLEAGMASLRELKKEMQATGLFASMAETSDVTRQIRADDAPVTQDMAKLDAGFKALREEAEKLEEQAEATTVQVAKSFGDMAEGVIDALNQMSNSIRSGDFLSILSSVLNMGLKLGGAGVFGKTIQTNINSVQKKAAGGRIFGPGTGTSDSVPLWASHGEYIVNARSTAQFLPALEAINAGRVPKLAKGGLVTPSLPASMRRGVGGSSGGASSGGGGDTYYLQGNLMTPEFWAQINTGHAVAAQAGGELGYRKVVTKGRRRLA